MTFEEYLAQFAGVEVSPEIVIEDDEDMQSFNTMYRKKWANEHRSVIQEWRDMQAKDSECEDCNTCLNACS